jgi:CRISPR/Cas system-associated protein Cas10 (large subunit of type III CRISPR-Cas system)
MDNMQYLYGASVQGIQDFIFSSNELKEIVGASEIVKEINEMFGREFEGKKDVEILLNAAGNIKAVFKDKGSLQNHILEFEKKIRQKAYGITISQAVVEFRGEVKDYLSKLEEKLKKQRNRPTISLDRFISVMDISPKKGRPLFQKIKEANLDKASFQKRVKYSEWFREKLKENPTLKEYKDISQLSNFKNKIAVIHIDGNGLGKLIPELEEKYGIKISDFSKKLDKATKEAFREAVEKVFGEDKKYRDVILGGDDVSVIMSGDFALDFVKEYLRLFEKKTSEIFKGKRKLTAAAGITYCNEKFPFHYAINLAEELCSEAKKRSKRQNSALMFHNIQSSYFTSFDEIKEKELKVGKIEFDFGPYYIDKEPDIDTLLKLIGMLRDDKSPASRLRELLKELDSEFIKHKVKRVKEMAEKRGFDVDRFEELLKKLNKNLSFENLAADNKTPLYDILQIVSITKEIK